jgi:hypothetical protein
MSICYGVRIPRGSGALATHQRPRKGTLAAGRDAIFSLPYFGSLKWGRCRRGLFATCQASVLAIECAFPAKRFDRIAQAKLRVLGIGIPHFYEPVRQRPDMGAPDLSRSAVVDCRGVQMRNPAGARHGRRSEESS